MQPVLHITGSVMTAAIASPSRLIASASASASFHGRMIRFSSRPCGRPGPCGTGRGCASGPALAMSGCLLQYTWSEKPWYMPSKRISFGRFVNARARRVAYSTASVPVLHRRTCSTLGTAAMILSASFFVRGRQCEYGAALLDEIDDRLRDARRPMPEQHRTETQQVIDVLVAIDVGEPRTGSALHEQRIGRPARPRRARGAVDATRNGTARDVEQLAAARSVEAVGKLGGGGRGRGVCGIHG